MFIAYGDYTCIEDIQERYPQAVKIVAVSGGWMMFDNATDYLIWERQR